MTHIDPSQVAMLCQGTELYGVGTIQKIYARHLPDMLLVCMREGALWDWLRENHPRSMLVPGLSEIVAGSSIGTLLRLPGLRIQARRDASALHEIFCREGIKIAHTHWLPQQLIGVWLRPMGYKVAWQINNLTSRTRLFGLGLKLNHAFARRGADLLLPASDFIADFWRESGVMMRTVRNCAEPVYESSNTLPPAPVRCVIAGRLEPEKGHHLAAAAVGRARGMGHDVSLDIFGGPLENNSYADQLRGEGIRLMGFSDTLRQVQQHYHLGLQCRVTPEPCSLWVCETLVDGLPLLAAANGGTPELVQDGATGLLFRSGDVDDLAAKLVELLESPQRLASMREAAFARGRELFTPARFIRETLDAYNAIVDSAAT